MLVPVLDKNNKPLMPCHPARARELLRKGKAVKRWFKSMFAIKLIDRDFGYRQQVVVGIDPGSKREGYSVKSESHTYLNIQCSTVDWVKDKIETKRNMRRGRRFRKTPYRKCRSNRLRNRQFLPPSTKARWQLKIRVLNFLRKLYPINVVVVEDIKAVTKKGAKKWNVSFSPLEVGKAWFYKQIEDLGLRLELQQGYDTSNLRLTLGLTKNKAKLSETFETHCVDSWVLANWFTGGHLKPDNKEIVIMKPLNFIKRQLHKLQFSKGSKRTRVGGTQSLGFIKGSIVKHIKRKGVFLIGGWDSRGIDLLDSNSGVRSFRGNKPEYLTHLAYNGFVISQP